MTDPIRRSWRFGGALLVGFALACSPEASDSTEAASDSTRAPRIEEALDTESTSRDSGATLAIEGDGLRVFLIPSGSARPIPFGTARADALARLTAVLGEEPATGDNADCGVRYASWENGLTVLFANDELAGWALRPRSALTTASGIGLGTTRAELEDAYVIDVRRTTLGEEFSAGGMAGTFDADARIEHLWAGVACIAR